MKLNYVRRISAYVSTIYHSEYITGFLARPAGGAVEKMGR